MIISNNATISANKHNLQNKSPFNTESHVILVPYNQRAKFKLKNNIKQSKRFITFVKLAHLSTAISLKSMPLYYANYLQVFASPNFHRETKKLKVGPTSRSPPTLIKRKLTISKNLQVYF
uniref:Uncharacterized protein n=1 Tax=Schizaphis graminum TaxID=13262 RepID=A0A2S2PH96_SCHGA